MSGSGVAVTAGDSPFWTSTVSSFAGIPSTVTRTCAPGACLRAFRAEGAGIRAEHADHLAEVLHGLVGALPDDLGRPGLLRGRVRPELQRAGMDGQQGDVVGEDVVHLPGEPLAFQVPCLLDP
jgi:hypothetical protein